MLENLNRIFGACFPPLVILGWLGAGIFLYTAFRSREWRKKLTGAEGFLALLLFFMMANRIPNPAIISFRYVIGIGILTLFWSVWLLRWSWHNCPAPLRRWRGMLLLALVFGICLGGFLKEIRLSKRTRRETEIIRFLRTERAQGKTKHRVWLTTDDRLERMIISAGRDDFSQIIVSEKPEEWKYILPGIRNWNEEICFYLGIKELKKAEAILDSLLIPAHRMIRFQNSNVMISAVPTKNISIMKSGGSETIFQENFSNLQEVPEQDGNYQELKRRGVGFAKQPLFLPSGWRPNSTHGYKGHRLEQIELKVIPDGIYGNSLFFSGNCSGSVMYSRLWNATSHYRCSFLFRGKRNSTVSLNVYLYNAAGGFIKTKELSMATGSGEENTLYIQTPIYEPEAACFMIALRFYPGQGMVDNLQLELDKE